MIDDVVVFGRKCQWLLYSVKAIPDFKLNTLWMEIHRIKIVQYYT